MAALINLFLLLVSVVLLLFPAHQWKPEGGKSYISLPGACAPLGISKSAGFYADLPCAMRGKYISGPDLALKSQYMLKQLSNYRSAANSRESLLYKKSLMFCSIILSCKKKLLSNHWVKVVRFNEFHSCSCVWVSKVFQASTNCLGSSLFLNNAHVAKAGCRGNAYLACVSSSTSSLLTIKSPSPWSANGVKGDFFFPS